MKVIDQIKQVDDVAIVREKKQTAKVYTISKGAGFYNNIYQRIIICKVKDILKHI